MLFKMDFVDNREYCAKCYNLAYTEKVFEEVGRFIKCIEHLVHAFWCTDLQVIEGIKKFAELPNAFDYQRQLYVYEHELSIDAEEYDNLLRYEEYEGRLYKNDWNGLTTYWRALVFEMLRNQWACKKSDWPISSLMKV